MNNLRNDPLTILIAIVGFAAVVGGTVVGVLVALPDSQNPGTVLTIVLGFFGVLATLLSNLLLGGRANQKLDSQEQQLASQAEVLEGADKKLDRVLNGEMDAKIERAVHKVLDARAEPTS